MTSRAKREEERRALINEFLEKEDDYTAELDRILVEYVVPLTENQDYYKVYDALLDKLFGPIRTFREFQQIFNTMLKNRTKPVVEIFMKMMHITKEYENYMRKHEQVILTIASLKGNEKFYQFLQDDSSGKKGAKHLPNLLMTPFERVTEYYEFFRQLQLRTPARHAEHEKVDHVFSKIDKLNNFMRQYQATYENMTSLLRIQMRISGDFETFVQSGRFFVYEGEVTFETRGKSVQYNLYLFNDMLLWTTSRGVFVDSCEFLEPTFNFESLIDEEAVFWFGVHGQKQKVRCASSKSREDWVTMIARHRRRILREQSKKQDNRAFGSRAPSIGSSRSRRSLRDRAESVSSRTSGLASPRVDLTPRRGTRSHRSSMASSTGYGFERAGSVHSFDVQSVASHQSRYSGRSGRSASRTARRRKESVARGRKASDASAGRLSVGRKGSAAGHGPRDSNVSHSTLPSTRGLGNINKSDYAYSDYSASSNPDSIDIKANSDFNSKQLQKVYQRLQRANAKILKYEEASKAQKKLVRDLQDSNTELRAQNQRLRKEKKEIEKKLKKMKNEFARAKKNLGKESKGSGRNRSGTSHRRRNSFHDLLVKSQSAANVGSVNVTMMADPATGLVVDGAAPVILQNNPPEPFVTNPGTLFTDASGAGFYIASPEPDGTQQVVQTQVTQPMYILS